MRFLETQFRFWILENTLSKFFWGDFWKKYELFKEKYLDLEFWKNTLSKQKKIELLEKI